MKEQDWLAVPKGARSHRCQFGGCTKQVYWVKRARPGRFGPPVLIAVDCEVIGGEAPDANLPGRGINHFPECASARKEA